MASRQLGKLRQWAGEVISPKDKSIVTDEFKDLESDIDLRKEGANRLFGASAAYHHALSKKKLSDAAGDSEKLLPMDALGIVMIAHGEQFPEESQFGCALVKMGRAQSKVAMLQEAYALTFKDTFIAAIERFREEIKEYEALRKKLDGRRSVLESATTKYEKTRNSKKDKDKREAEDELERARQRYDETIEDMRAHMHALQENEVTQERELSSFLDIEMNFAQQYLDVLKDVRGEWPTTTQSRQTRPRSVSQPKLLKTPTIPSRSLPASSQTPAGDSSENEEIIRPPSRGSKKHKKSDSAGSRGPSRPSSRLSRRRTHSSATAEDKERPKEEKPRRPSVSVAGWASSAVDSITSRGKKSKDKEAFSTLDDDGDLEGVTGEGKSPTLRKSNSFSLSRAMSKKKHSKDNIPSPIVPPRILKPPSLQDKRVVKALYDFNGSADELTFKAGTDIKVLNEVVDGWWMGEIDGRKGLFPTSYVSGSPPRPSRPYRSDEQLDVLKPNGPQYAMVRDDGYITSDIDEEYGHQPLAHSRSPFYSGFNDVAATSDHPEDTDTESATQAVKAARRFSDDLDMYMDKQSKATPKMRHMALHDGDIANQPLLSRTMSDGPPSPVVPRKAPPPPPPPRRPILTSQTATPAIPERKLGPTNRPAVPARPSVNSSTDSMQTYPNTGASTLLAGSSYGPGLDYDISPFESAAELTTAPNTRGCGRFSPGRKEL